MSHKISNLFASRAFSEHPLALWSLDDDMSFVSMLSENNKDIITWTLNNAEEAYEVSSAPNIPMGEEESSIVIPIAASPQYMDFLGPNINLNLTKDPNKTTITISSFIYAFESAVQSIEIGFAYKNNEDVEYTYNTSEITVREQDWLKITHTIDLVEKDIFKGYIKIFYSGNVINNDYAVQINGLSIGQWSEVFHSDSTGVIPINLPDSVLNSLIPNSEPLGFKVIEADAYGLLDGKNGYYFIDNNKMLAVNYGIPMAFGSDNVTKIYQSVTEGVPSLAFPGQGFLNRSGINKQYTAEFWLRLYTNAISPIRIFGPISSNDGLYVEEEFLTVRIGRYTKSHFIGKWFRPMLIHLRYNADTLSLLINGDTVISIELDQEYLSFPFAREDWLGFYGNDNVTPLEIDSFAIYPYIMPNQLAKKKYVYGQGVSNIENVINNFNGESVSIDFPFANYSSTMNYPNMTGWNAGFFNNLESNSKFLSFPSYTLPEFIYVGSDLSVFDLSIDFRNWLDINERTWDFWDSNDWQTMRILSAANTLYDNLVFQEGNNTFIKLKPNDMYNELNGSIYFDSMNPIDSTVKSIFSIFRSPDQLPEEPEIVMQFTSKVSFNNFRIEIDTSGLNYYYNDTLLENKALTASTDFVAGIELDSLNSTYSAILQNFFANPQNLSLNIGGYELSTFSGRIYKTNFNNKLYTSKDLQSYIGENGIFDIGIDDYIMKYVGNYTHHFIKTDEALVEDIGCVGYWEDSLPLTYFAKFVKDEGQNDYYDLDMLQFNIDSPSPIIVSGTPTQTEDTALKVSTYVSIQDFASVGKKPYTDYINVEAIKENRVLEIDNYTYSQILNTKFEIIDGTIIFPPKDQVDFEDYYITTHIELKTEGILNKTVRIKNMSYSSLAFDERSFYPINTRTGNKIYPFHKIDETYIFKTRNPFRIYKDSTSYIHLTADSGISVIPYEIDGDRGLTIPINNQRSPEYTLGGIQFYLLYNKDYLINERTKVGSIKTSSNTFDIYMETETGGKRGKVKLYNVETGLEDTNSIFYQNGRVVTNPVIEPSIWTSIIISFSQDINLNSQIGQFEIYEGFVYNNIAMFNKSAAIFGTIIEGRDWNDVKSTVVDIPGLNDPTVDNSWLSWTNFNWREVWLTEDILSFTVNGEDIHQSLFGLAKATIRDDSVLSFNSDSFRIISNATWTLYEGKVV
jgi:hypothetical protein